jgi:hypothetical protein
MSMGFWRGKTDCSVPSARCQFPADSERDCGALPGRSGDSGTGRRDATDCPPLSGKVGAGSPDKRSGTWTARWGGGLASAPWVSGWPCVAWHLVGIPVFATLTYRSISTMGGLLAQHYGSVRASL